MSNVSGLLKEVTLGGHYLTLVKELFFRIMIKTTTLAKHQTQACTRAECVTVGSTLCRVNLVLSKDIIFKIFHIVAKVIQLLIDVFLGHKLGLSCLKAKAEKKICENIFNVEATKLYFHLITLNK